MFRRLLHLRYLAVVVAVLFAIHATGFLVLGILRTIHAYSLLVQSVYSPVAERPGILLAESVDVLLFALVLIVLAIGTASLFLTSTGHSGEDSHLPPFMRVRSLGELKLLLWEAILATLVVAAG